jgi:hypothetical protein
MTRLCAVEGCGKPARGRGHCHNHYYRLHKYGDPLAGKTFYREPLRFIHEVALKHTGDACLKWPYSIRRDGFGQIQIDRKSVTVSRYVCELAHGAPPTSEHQAAHSCGKGHEACISPVHVRWATRAENEADKLLHGTDNRGEKNPVAKLTWVKVKKIRSQKGNKSNRELADEFGVAPSTISVIQAGKTWV